MASTDENMGIRVVSMPDRIEASLPADDPRFTAMRAVLASVRQRGKGSPGARMLGEWALLGYKLMAGELAIAGEAGAIQDARADYDTIRAAQEHASAALADMTWE